MENQKVYPKIESQQDSGGNKNEEQKVSLTDLINTRD